MYLSLILLINYDEFKFIRDKVDAIIYRFTTNSLSLNHYNQKHLAGSFPSLEVQSPCALKTQLLLKLGFHSHRTQLKRNYRKLLATNLLS
ncbi:MAG: hypothetical protein KPI85_05380 [cyanobacterium endosymbiont of Epithemia adnata isolate EadnSB Bon19]